MDINSYQLSRSWFDFCFENPELINPAHTAIFMFSIEHCNRLGWKEKFGFPSQMTMDALGIKNHHTYIKYFNDLVEWGFFKLIQKSTNQYSANIISLSIGKSKNNKALDKAFIKHATKQPSEQVHSNPQSTPQSNDSIDKQITNNHITTNKEQQTIDLVFPFESEMFIRTWQILVRQPKWKKKSIDALNATLKKLAIQTEQDAIQMMNDAIAGGWQGIFELKNNQKNGTGFIQNRKQQHTTSVAASVAETYREAIAEQ